MSQIPNVFLIDDSETFNFIHAKIMKNADFAQTIKTFDSGQAALAQIRQLSRHTRKNFRT